MGKYLDLDDVCYGNPEAQKELDELRGALAASKSLLDSLRAELEVVKAEKNKSASDIDTLADHNIELQYKLASAKDRIEEMRKGEPVAWAVWNAVDRKVEHCTPMKETASRFKAFCGDGHVLMPLGFLEAPPELPEGVLKSLCTDFFPD